MIKVPFKVSARTAKLIGLENFSNEEGAIIELVKNTYDADSKNCILIFDLKYKKIINKKNQTIQIPDREKSKIYVIDNGIGMTDDIISNQWMTIGTDDKLHQHTSKLGRVKTGAKGIGRFALNRLGLLTDLFTFSQEKKEAIEWIVNWQDFDKQGATVSDIEAVVTKRNDFVLKEDLLKRFGKYDTIVKLINGISFESGTLIEISQLNDSWDEVALQRLFGNLEMLLPPKEQSDFRIDFFTTNNIDQFGEIKSAYHDDYDYRIESNYGENLDEKENLEIKITRNELDVEALEKQYSEIFNFDALKIFPYQLKDFKEKTIVLNKNLEELLSNDVDKSLIDQLGKFKFTFYFLKNTISDDKADGDLKKYPYRRINSAHRKSWLKRFGGIKIFRDDFRIRPYGENGVDWLKLGERQSQSPGGPGQRLGGYRIGPNQIAGTINISRIHNPSFQDKSGREGIIENDVFELFKNVIREIIAVFEKDRNVIMYHLSELSKIRDEEAEKLRRAQEEATKITEIPEKGDSVETIDTAETLPLSSNGDTDNSKDNSDFSEREKLLATGVQILTSKNDKKDEEIRLLRSLASVGLIISSLAHEVKSLRSRLIPRTSFLLAELSKYLDEKKMSKVDKDDNPFYMIRLMQEEDVKLKHWLDYSLTTLKKDKRERTNLNFNDYFERFKSTWVKALSQRGINLNLLGDPTFDCIVKVFEVDMDSIFNNLLSNSMNALKGDSKGQKNISISWKRLSEGDVEIIFSDNGKGLDPHYRNNPSEIFNLHESSKKDSKGNIIGTGLGLYIVRTIIEEHNNSSISIIEFINGLHLKITFKTNKNEA